MDVGAMDVGAMDVGAMDVQIGPVMVLRSGLRTGAGHSPGQGRPKSGGGALGTSSSVSPTR